MELFLWISFYEPKWFYNFNITWRFYQLIWIIPLILHICMAASGFAIFFYSDYSTNNASLLLWLFSRTFFSVLLTFDIIFFMRKSYLIYKKEKEGFEESISIFPELKRVNQESNYWIIRKSIKSTPGVFLLFLGIISLLLSYMMIKIYYLGNQFGECSESLQIFLDYHLYIIIFANIPLLIITFIFLFIKLGSFACAYICPGLLITSSKMCTPKIIRLKQQSH